MDDEKSSMFAADGLDSGTLNTTSAEANPALDGATMLFQMAPGLALPYEYGGVAEEIAGYQESAWIGTTLMISPVYDVIGPDACKFLESICVNDFSKLRYTGLRHAILCNDKGQVLSDGVVIRLSEERYRTYWINPPIQYYVETSDMDVRGEDMTGKEYFIQIDGEKSLEILEDAFQQDLHDIKFAKRREIEAGGCTINVIRLGMSGNLAYEIHGPIEEYAKVYKMVWASGEKFGAKKLGMHAYNEFNHTEGNFPNICQHYPMPVFESDPKLAAWLREHPATGAMNSNRVLSGSSADLEERFVTPYDVGWGFLCKFNHEFPGRKVLEKLADKPERTCVTLEWNPQDVGTVFAALNTPGAKPVDDISQGCDLCLGENSAHGYTKYRADEVYANGKKIGITAGRIHSYNYNAMISLAFVDPAYAVEGSEVTVLWGTPGTKQMEIRAKVVLGAYNKDYVRNEDRDVEDVPRRF